MSWQLLKETRLNCKLPWLWVLFFILCFIHFKLLSWLHKYYTVFIPLEGLILLYCNEEFISLWMMLHCSVYSLFIKSEKNDYYFFIFQPLHYPWELMSNVSSPRIELGLFSLQIWWHEPHPLFNLSSMDKSLTFIAIL